MWWAFLIFFWIYNFLYSFFGMKTWIIKKQYHFPYLYLHLFLIFSFHTPFHTAPYRIIIVILMSVLLAYTCVIFSFSFFFVFFYRCCCRSHIMRMWCDYHASPRLLLYSYDTFSMSITDWFLWSLWLWLVLELLFFFGKCSPDLVPSFQLDHRRALLVWFGF